MVLDNTGSMSGAKLEDLKTAATKLTNQILQNGDGVHKIGLVPFAQYVNVDPANGGQSWVMEPPSGDDDDDDDDDGPSWSGCAGSRDYPLNVEDNSFTTNPVPGVTSTACPQPILPLTTNKTVIVDNINAMTADGLTYIAAGLSWGLRVISNDAPFSQGDTTANIASQNGVKAIVLLTDGANTRSASYPEHDSQVEADANALTSEVCDEVKAQNIRIYTIVFELSDTTIENLMQNCASADGGYFDADNASELNAAFSDIAVDITDLALTR